MKVMTATMMRRVCYPCQPIYITNTSTTPVYKQQANIRSVY